MATYGKLKFSNGTDGLGILVVATSTLGTAIHTAVSGTDDYDEIFLYAYNTSTSNVKLTVEFGGVADKDLTEKTIQAETGAILIIPGYLLQNSKIVTAFAATTNVIAINGWVNRLTA